MGARRARGPSNFWNNENTIPTNKQSRSASVFLDTALGPARIERNSVVPEATQEASRGPEKGAVSAQKAFRGSETETRELLGGTEEDSVSPMRGY